MRRFALALLLWFLSGLPVLADGPYYFPYLPVFNPCEVGGMSDWKVVVPVGTTNKVLNPSGEITGNFTQLTGTTVSRDTALQHYGLYSYRVQTNANNEGVSFTLEVLDNTDHYVTMRVSGTLPTAWDWSLDDTTYTAPTLLETFDSTWKLYGLSVPAAQANGSTELYVRQNGAGVGDFWLDGIQVEANGESIWSTFCDGTQPGCEWNGTPHASSSTRSGDSRAGGIVYDLEDDYGFNVSGMSGTGTAPQELFIDSYSQLPGGELNARKEGSRAITLTGFIDGTNEADLYAKKQALESLFDPDAVPEDENGEQPVRLRFNGAAVHKEIAVFYETGLETNITADEVCAREKVAVRFIADDPWWYEIGESAALLDTNDSATFERIAARLKSTGQWSNLGNPSVNGLVNAIVEDDVYIYFGGAFTNFGGDADADRIARYNKQTGAISAMGTGLGAAVIALALAPNGDLYIGGAFTNAGGVADADYLTRWDGSSYNAVGVPNTGAASITNVQTLAFDLVGNLYISGIFANWADIANADGIVMWDGSSYSALGTGMGASVANAIAVYSDNSILLGGNFTTFNGNSHNYIAKWDGSDDIALGTGFDALVNAIVIAPGNIAYIGGAFTTANGIAASLIVSHNGTEFIPLGDGITTGTVVNDLAFRHGALYIAGLFTSAGFIDLTDGFARWNGYTYSHFDFNPPGSGVGVIILLGRVIDPVVPSNFDIWVVFSGSSGTGAYAGLETVSNGGTAPAFPKIIYNRSGGDGAVIQTLRNERTGKELLFDYSLLDGETLTIDLAPTKKSITSSTGLPAQNAVLPNSDLGDWALLTGNNNVTSFVSEDGSPTVTGYLLWKDTFKSQN